MRIFRARRRCHFAAHRPFWSKFVHLVTSIITKLPAHAISADATKTLLRRDIGQGGRRRSGVCGEDTPVMRTTRVFFNWSCQSAGDFFITRRLIGRQFASVEDGAI
jgi:hypothetical protein